VADARGNACDLCPFVSDDGLDGDGDGAGDACDCAFADPAARPPAEVSGVVAGKPLPGAVRLAWPQAPAADAYSVTRSRVSQIDADSFGHCLVPMQTQDTIDDAEIPPTGDGFAYLIQGIDSTCGIGTLGAGPGGRERVNSDPDRCCRFEVLKFRSVSADCPFVSGRERARYPGWRRDVAGRRLCPVP
jgi:hypothetical protein